MYLDALTERVPCTLLWTTPTVSAGSQFISVTLLNYQQDTHNIMLPENRVFSAIPIDQAHQQNNACIKRDGWAVGLTNNPSALRRWVVGLTDNPSALRRWVVADPEVIALIDDFEDAHQLMGRRDGVLHHDRVETLSRQTSRRWP